MKTFSDVSFSPDEMMTIAASRLLGNRDICFVGIGAPSAACNLARLTHAPDITLIYESGTIGTRPRTLPLSIGDGELCETALTTVSVPEMFRYWLQSGRITVGFLGGAQIDKRANLNTTVIGPYEQPKVRLPGGGGAPEIATCCQQVFITMNMSVRAFVDPLPFITSMGHGLDCGDRAKLGLPSRGPTKVITDLCILEPDEPTGELAVTALHPGIGFDQVQANCGWPLRRASSLTTTPNPTELELRTLRELHAATEQEHRRGS